MSPHQTSYTAPAIALHWLVFVLVACAWSLGYYTADLPFSPQKLKYISWHKWLGITIFIVVAFRLTWRLRYPPPAFPLTRPLWQSRVAAGVHWTFYGLLFSIPLTGWLFSSAAGVPTVFLGLIQLPDLVGRDKQLATGLRQVHQTLNWTLLVLVCGHALIALKHHFIDRDDIPRRMLPLFRSR
jgi:cytochrome b561